MKGKRNLTQAAKRRASADRPSMAALRRQIMSGQFQTARDAAAPEAASPKAPRLPAAPPGVPALPQAVDAERKRVAALSGLHTQAERMGLDFDLTAAITSALPVQKARTNLLNQMAADDEAIGELAAGHGHDAAGNSGHSGISADRKRAAFAKGLNQGMGGLR